LPDVGADEGRALEPASRCIARSALANERVLIIAAGGVVVEHDAAWRGSATHMAIIPLGCMPRLYPLDSRPRL
jgi:hypothetical protein